MFLQVYILDNVENIMIQIILKSSRKFLLVFSGVTLDIQSYELQKLVEFQRKVFRILGNFLHLSQYLVLC